MNSSARSVEKAAQSFALNSSQTFFSFSIGLAALAAGLALAWAGDAFEFEFVFVFAAVLELAPPGGGVGVFATSVSWWYAATHLPPLLTQAEDARFGSDGDGWPSKLLFSVEV